MGYNELLVIIGLIYAQCDLPDPGVHPFSYTLMADYIRGRTDRKTFERYFHVLKSDLREHTPCVSDFIEEKKWQHKK